MKMVTLSKLSAAMRHQESRLQAACVRYFRMQFPEYAYMLISVPNGVATTATQGRILKAYTIKDNVNGGEWNWDDIANEWDVEQLAEFGLDNAMLQQWDELPYIEEEQEDPTLDKDIKLTVVIPFAEKDIKSQVESKVKDALREFPNVTLKW